MIVEAVFIFFKHGNIRTIYLASSNLIKRGIMKYILFLMYFLSFTSIYADKPSAITYWEGGSRLGDQLIMYCKAKWFSYKYNLPFLCPDFKLKNKFMMAEKENHLTKEVEARFTNKKYIKHEKEMNPLASDTLYFLDLFVSSYELPDVTHGYDQNVAGMKKVFNDHPAFFNELHLQIAPRDSIAQFILPEDQITVAVHVRRGCGGDFPLLSKNSYSDKIWPAKFPPDSYYIEQIRRLDTILGHQPMYVYIFTDHKDSEHIADKYKKALNLPNVSFGYRKNNAYENYVIEDLFAMTQFDCLIRSSSHYSAISYLLGDHKYMVASVHGVWRGNQLTIDRSIIAYRHDDGSISYEYINS